jgi:Fur family ferric uptake transcriptional regulator
MPTAEQELKEYLRQEGYRLTPERFEVLDAVMTEPGHFEADDLFFHLKESGSKVSRATVYKTLQILEECDLVYRQRVGKHGSRYEKAFGRPHHDHLICIHCGKIVEFIDPVIENRQKNIASSHDFELINHSHQLFGLCPKCRSKKHDKQNNLV